MEHVYSKRFQGKVNVLGYIVDGVPFLKLFDAETYCLRRGLNVDEAITLNQKRAKELAVALMPEYKYMIGVFEEMLEDAQKHLTLMRECHDKALNQRGIEGKVNSEVYQDYILDAIGKYSAVSEALNHLRGRSMELYSISRLTITEGVLP